ncbi:AzlD domain-containing protein [Arenibaculum sp.]|jgi:branched-subunit amino acid transport protein|uniref:AzlD domain-containing protein n=1 Tax=Arenibaculum sp. TaxID=2865862 RepID=UPI002E100112|nr:AzlD domain-containing protein [Arenibaculum sp.]
MDQSAVFLTIVGMTLVTYLPRLLPAWLLSKRSLPDAWRVWLAYVPISVVSAMLLPALVLREGAVDLGFSNLELWAAVPTILVGVLTRSLFATVLTGMLGLTLLRELPM